MLIIQNTLFIIHELQDFVYEHSNIVFPVLRMKKIKSIINPFLVNLT